MYKVHQYADASEFLNKTKASLEKHELVHTFPLWVSDLALADAATGQAKAQSYSAITKLDHTVESNNDDAVVVLAAVFYDGFMYISGGGMHEQPMVLDGALGDALDELIRGCPTNLHEIKRFHGYRPFLDQVAARWTTNCHEWKYESVWSYVLEKREGAHNVNWTDAMRAMAGRMEIATERDLPLLKTWIQHFMIDDGYFGPMSDAEAIAFCTKEIKARAAYIFHVDDVPVGTVYKRRVLRQGLSLGYVFTDRAHRRKGYGAAMVATMTRDMLENEDFQYVTLLMNGQRDPKANCIYHDIGYQLCGRLAFLVRAENTN
ncbi:hypothetical protein BC940DRAFT_307984 [Gongronella butleri]|nr:hypothetical protein BC940DRAFT_307984 [Gongronella butleri]